MKKTATFLVAPTNILSSRNTQTVKSGHRSVNHTSAGLTGSKSVRLLEPLLAGVSRHRRACFPRRNNVQAVCLNGVAAGTIDSKEPFRERLNVISDLRCWRFDDRIHLTEKLRRQFRDSFHHPLAKNAVF